jgi:hypothetical protein
MRKKSIEQLARELAKEKPGSALAYPLAWSQWVADVKAAARGSAATNATFDYDRFYDMVGLPDHERSGGYNAG